MAMINDKWKPVNTYLYLFFIILLSALPNSVGTAWGTSDDPNYGQSYIGNPEKEKKSERQFLRKRIAVARINDGTKVEGSPFGQSATVQVKKEDGTTEEAQVVVQNDDAQTRSRMGRIMNGFTERLITNLFETENFIILEREHIHKILREQDFQKNGRVSEETIVKSGRVLGVQYIITGSIFTASGEEKDMERNQTDRYRFPNTNWSLKKRDDDKPRAHKFPGSNKRYKDKEKQREFEEKEKEEIKNRVEGEAGFYALHLRVYDVTTSQVVAASRIVGETQWSLIDGAVNNIVKLLKQEPWKGKVTDIVGNKVYFSGGKDVGMETGRTLTIVTRGKPIIDPDEGFVLGYIENDIGKIKVVSVKQKYSVGEVISTTKEIKKGDIVNPQEGDYVVDQSSKQDTDT